MSSTARIFVSGLTGAVVCAVLAFAMFFILAMVDNTRPAEAFAYGLVVTIPGAFIGAIIGLAVGMGNLGVFGGALVGVALTLVVVVIYIFSSGGPGTYSYFWSESRIIFVVLTLPAVVTGIVTALFKNLLRKP